jgi:hypothetical protein
LSPEPYSLNVHVGNLQLPNYLHSSEGMNKFYRPEKKDCEDRFNVKIEGTVLSCKMPRDHLPFVACTFFKHQVAAAISLFYSIFNNYKLFTNISTSLSLRMK